MYSRPSPTHKTESPRCVVPVPGSGHCDDLFPVLLPLVPPTHPTNPLPSPRTKVPATPVVRISLARAFREHQDHSNASSWLVPVWKHRSVRPSAGGCCRVCRGGAWMGSKIEFAMKLSYTTLGSCRAASSGGSTQHQ